MNISATKNNGLGFRKIFRFFQTPYIIVALIVLLGAVLRFYNTPERYGFDYDATRDALISLYGAETLQLPLHGPPSALGDFHFGPWYYYYLILFTVIFPFHYAPWIAITVASLISIVIMYLLGKELADSRLGYILAVLTAVSPAQIVASTGLSNPDLVFVCAAAVLWIFVKALKSSLSLWWALVWGFVLGVGISNHYQMALFLIFPLLYIINTQKKGVLFFFTTLLGIGVAALPLFFFNAINHWHTVQGVWFYLSEGKDAIYVPNSWTIYLRDFWPEFWAYSLGVPILFGLILGIISIIIFVHSILTKKLTIPLLSIFITFSGIFLYLRYYSGVRENYYLLFLHPFIFLILGYSIWYLLYFRYGKVIVTMLTMLLAFIVIPTGIKSGHTMQSYIEYHQDISMILEKYPVESFTVYDCGRRDRGRSQAYVFIFSHMGKLSEAGVPIGVFDETCYSPELKRVKDTNQQTDTRLKQQVIERNIVIFDMHRNEIKNAGWTLITPKTVFDRELRWWYEK